MRPRLIIADNHPLFRNGVRQIVDDSEMFHVIAEVGDGESCLFQAIDLEPDYLILDLNLPGKSGFEIAEALRAKGSECRIVILSMHSSAEFVAHAKQIGCQGFVAKEDAGHELIEILVNNESEFSMSSSAGSGEATIGLNAPKAPIDNHDLERLTPTELRVIHAISDSLTSAEIGEIFHISERTVHTHRQNICKKLDLAGPNSLIRFSIENKDAISRRVKRAGSK